MKRTNRILAIILIAVITVLSLASCGGGNVASTGTAKIVIEKAEGGYTVYNVLYGSFRQIPPPFSRGRP